MYQSGLIYRIKKWLMTMRSIISDTTIDVPAEIIYVRNWYKQETAFPTLDDLGLKYIPDRILGVIPWDWQFDSIKTIERGGGDCNSLHRLFLMIAHIRGYEAYQIDIVFKGTMTGHSSVLLKGIGDEWRTVDYGDFGPICHSPDEAVEELSTRYGHKLHCYVAQTISWTYRRLK